MTTQEGSLFYSGPFLLHEMLYEPETSNTMTRINLFSVRMFTREGKTSWI